MVSFEDKAREIIKPNWPSIPEHEKLLFYGGKNWRFSNFAPIKFKYKGRIWFTAEHPYQAAKFDPNDSEISADIWADIVEANDPGLAKEIAYLPENIEYIRSDWEMVKFQEMLDIKREQLKQNPKFCQNLLDSNGLIIIEDSSKDEIWGRGPNNDGLDMLGVDYMIIREELRGEYGVWSKIREELGLA